MKYEKEVQDFILALKEESEDTFFFSIGIFGIQVKKPSYIDLSFYDYLIKNRTNYYDEWAEIDLYVKDGKDFYNFYYIASKRDNVIDSSVDKVIIDYTKAIDVRSCDHIKILSEFVDYLYQINNLRSFT